MSAAEGRGAAGGEGRAEGGGLAGGDARPRVASLTPAQARRALAEAGSDLVLLDVREPEELSLAQVEGALAIPMGEVFGRLAEIPRDRPVAVLCHHGIRSWHVAAALTALGFARVSNVEGGIDRWSLEADPSVPRYDRPS